NCVAQLGFAVPGTCTQIARIVVPRDGQLLLRCDATTQYACHSLWILENATVELEQPARALAFLTEHLREVHSDPSLGADPSDHPIAARIARLEQSIGDHVTRRRVQGERRSAPESYAVCIPLHPSHAALLEMNLSRAREVGALGRTRMLQVVEDETDPARRTDRVRRICAQYGVAHRYADSPIGYFTSQQTRSAIRCLSELAESLPDVGWILRADADLLL